MVKCLVEDCELEATRRNMCQKHYRRYMKYGDPNTLLRTSPGELLRFLHEDVLSYKGDECLPWPYSCNFDGYGQISIDGKTTRVHVIVCETVHGSRPSQDHVASHKCGNGHLGCCTPSHLKWQTRAEDSADRVIHGTQVRGSQQWDSKLTEGDVLKVRSLKGKLSQAEIARMFSVNHAVISRIMRGKTWKWLKHYDDYDVPDIKPIHLIPDMESIDHPQMILSFGG